MSNDIEVKENRVVEHYCRCGYTIIGYRIHDGIVPFTIKCPHCSKSMYLKASNCIYIDCLWYKPCKERVEAEPTLAKKNNTLVEYNLKGTNSSHFIDACLEYAKENYNPDSKLDYKFHPAIVLIWELMREDKDTIKSDSDKSSK